MIVSINVTVCLIIIPNECLAAYLFFVYKVLKSRHGGTPSMLMHHRYARHFTYAHRKSVVWSTRTKLLRRLLHKNRVQNGAFRIPCMNNISRSIPTKLLRTYFWIACALTIMHHSRAQQMNSYRRQWNPSAYHAIMETFLTMKSSSQIRWGASLTFWTSPRLGKSLSFDYPDYRPFIHWMIACWMYFSYKIGHLLSGILPLVSISIKRYITSNTKWPK
jgi:hypothetical protein